MSDDDKKGPDKLAISESTYRLVSLTIQATIPIAVIWFGTQVQSSIATANVAQQYTEMAMQILQEPPEETSDEVLVWAIKTVETYSPVKMSEAILDSLPKKVAVIPEFHIRVPVIPDGLMELPNLFPEDEKLTHGQLLIEYGSTRDQLIILIRYLREAQALYGTTDELDEEWDSAYRNAIQAIDEHQKKLQLLEEATKLADEAS